MVNHRKNAFRYAAEKFCSADMRCQLVCRDLLDLLLFLWAQQLLGFGILPGQIPYIVKFSAFVFNVKPLSNTMEEDVLTEPVPVTY